MSERRLLIVPTVEHDEPEYTHRVFKLLHLPVGGLTEQQHSSCDRTDLEAAHEVMGAENLWTYAQSLIDQDTEVRRRRLLPWLVRVAFDITEPLMLEQFVKLAHDTWGVPASYLRDEVSKLAIVEQLDPLLERFILWAEPRITAYVSQEWAGDLVDEVQVVMKALMEAPDKRIFTWGEQRVLAMLRDMRVPDAQQRLQQVVQALRAVQGTAAAGLVDQDPAPWPDPVDGAALLTELLKTYTTYIVLTSAAADALVLYTLMTYCFQHFDVLPNLLLKSPVKRCAKTKVLEVGMGLVRRPLATSNATAATLFRSIAAFEPTLLLDECDSFMTGKHSHNPSYTELKNIINSGHTRATAFSLRLVGDDHTPVKFSTYCPKLLASIGDLQDTVEDRSIILPMRRKKKTEKVQRWRNKYLALLEPTRRKALRWAKDIGEQLAEADPTAPDELNDRAQDCWRPLLAIADAVGGEWPQRARRAAKILATDEADQTEIGLRLLRDLQGIFANAKVEQLPTGLLLRALTAVPEAPWATWHRGQPLSERGLANLLRPFEIRSSNQRDGAVVRKGYQVDDLREAFDRYGGALSSEIAATAATNSDSVNETAELQDSSLSATEGSVAAIRYGATNGNRSPIQQSSGVADRKSSPAGRPEVVRTPMGPQP